MLMYNSINVCNLYLKRYWSTATRTNMHCTILPQYCYKSFLVHAVVIDFSTTESKNRFATNTTA